jgi:SAM-dependent methyltransferase
MTETPQTWHYGLVAKWWAEFNDGGPEIAYFQKYVERGQPALDVACGTGRLLIPYLQAGLDVDSCDVSPDMIALCCEKAERESLTPTLFVQPMHELGPPRTYRTIFVCGGFGLGSSREQDLEAVGRFYENLEPGGTLVLDNENPYSPGSPRDPPGLQAQRPASRGGEDHEVGHLFGQAEAGSYAVRVPRRRVGTGLSPRVVRVPRGRIARVDFHLDTGLQ